MEIPSSEKLQLLKEAKMWKEQVSGLKQKITLEDAETSA
jgi:hypothetical protein